MSQIYYKTFKVPTWIVVELNKEKTKVVSTYLDEAGAKNQKWPTDTYYDTLMAFKNKGWSHVIDANPIIITAQLLQLSVQEHVRTALHPKSIIEVPYTIGRLSRQIDSRKDAERLFSEILESQDSVVLSQMFQIGELCHSDGSKNYRAFYTTNEVNIKVLEKIADKVVVIGGKDADVNVSSSKTDEDIANKLNEYFGKQ